MRKSKYLDIVSQYRNMKSTNPDARDAIVLFRVGDFCEAFDDDAKRCADLLGLSLTVRGKGDDALHMTGFPHVMLESHLAKIVHAGQRALVCEQVKP